MNKLYALALSALAVASASAADFTKTKARRPLNIATTAVGSVNVNVDKNVTGYYDGTSYENIANYYTVVSSTDNATYDSNLGVASANSGWVVSIDFYSTPSTNLALPAGTYKVIEDPYPADPEQFTVIGDYSMCQYFDATGNVTVEAYLSGDVTVTLENETYTVKATALDEEGNIHNITYKGKLPYTDPSQTFFTYRQIKEDRNDEKFTGGMGFYYGTKLQTNKGGEMMIQLYSDSFNEENGMQYDGTTMICLDIVGRPFTDASNITIDAGTYPIVPLGQVERNTSLPGREITYMSQTVAIGTYLRDRDSQKYSADDPFAYALLQSGDIVIEKLDNGNYKISLDNGKTNLGFDVTFHYEGPIAPLIDYSDGDGDKGKLSTITDDVDMKLDDIKMARAYNGGIFNGCQTFLLDIGSRRLADHERDNGGDIIRVHFVNEAGTATIQPGSYTMASEKWDTYLKPGTLGQSRWVNAASGGTDASGTFYQHFAEGRIYIMDDYAWLTSGSAGVTILDSPDANGLDMRTYNVKMSFIADNSFYVKGEWTGPVKLMYNPDDFSAIGAIEADGSEAMVTSNGNGIFRVTNYIGQVQVYNIAGSLCGNFDASQLVDLSNTPAGVYIFKMGQKTVKIVK